MKPVRSPLARLVAVVIVFAAMGLARYFGAGSPSAGAGTEPLRQTSVQAEPAQSARTTGEEGSGLDLGLIPADDHRAQIIRVVKAMDETGAPPGGVVQGGRRGGVKGVFVNAEGRLPRRPAGYWVESDVWPKDGPRDAERLIFGRGDEVFWTRDHYRTFVRLR